MKIEEFRNLSQVVDLLTFWPFDLKNNSLLSYDKLYHVVKFCEDRLKIVTCRWQKDRQTQTDRITKSTNQYTWKIFDFTSNNTDRQTERQTNKRTQIHTLSSGDSNNGERNWKDLIFLGKFHENCPFSPRFHMHCSICSRTLFWKGMD